MKYRRGYFRNKKVTVMGLGLLGRGVGDIRFLASERAEIIVTDLKTKEELAASLEALKGFENITYVLGEHRLEDFCDRDFILKAASVPIDSPYILEARKNNIPIEMSAALFASLTFAMIIGVTGTRGKSTTTHLLYEILKKGLPDKKIFLGGNIKGVSTLEFLAETHEGDIAVLELDSWQLQGFGEGKISPHLAVFTTFFPDHLNYYKGNLDAYFEDKINIFKFQTEDDVLVLGGQVASLVKEKYDGSIRSTVLEVHSDALPQAWKVPIPGLHNRYNAALAMQAAKYLGVGLTIIRDTIEHFRGVPGRLEFIREYNEVKIYNDTTATTPEATLAGLRAFGLDPTIVLIFGGSDKGLEMGHLFMDMPNYVRGVVTLPGTGTDRIKNELQKLTAENSAIKVLEASNMEDAVHQAVSLSRRGENIVLSPGFASFGQFKNEFDRGDQFAAIVAGLK
jgi:UDP-N-acetylmuramoylalanine--D-glutamate ligase